MMGRLNQIWQRKGNKIIYYLIFGCSLPFFLYITFFYYWYDFDTAYYAISLEANPAWVWPYLTINLENLMFSGFGAILIPLGVPPYWAITLLTSVFGSLTLVVLFALSLQITRDRRWALVAVVLYFFNWSFIMAVKSSSNKTIVSFFTLVFFWYLTRIVQAKQYDFRHLAVLGFIFGLTFAAHVSSILLAPCFILLFFQIKKSQTERIQRPENLVLDRSQKTSTELPPSIRSPPSKDRPIRKFWLEIKTPLIDVISLLLISFWVWLGLVTLTFSIIAPGHELDLLLSLSPKYFFQTVHTDFFEWEGSGVSLTFRSSQGFLMDVWAGFLFTFYGVESLPTGAEGAFILLHACIMLFIFALGYRILLKKNPYLAISLIPLLVWVFLYETYEAERWTWVVMITPLLGLLGLQELFRRIKQLRPATDIHPAKGIRKFIKKQSPKIFAGVFLFFLIVPAAYQVRNYGIHSNEVYAMADLKAVIYASNSPTKDLFFPITANDTFTYYTGLKVYPPKLFLKICYLNYGPLTNLSILVAFYDKHVNDTGLILFMSNKTKETFLEQSIVTLELSPKPIFTNRLGSLYNFTITSI